MRRWAALIVGTLVLAGCDSEPDFDDRFEAAQAEIEEKAQSIEADLEAAEDKRAGTTGQSAGRKPAHNTDAAGANPPTER